MPKSLAIFNTNLLPIKFRRPRMSGRRPSGTSRRFPRHFLNCDFPYGKNLSSQTWPGSPRRPSPRHPRPPKIWKSQCFGPLPYNTRDSKKASEKVLGRVLGKGSQKGSQLAMAPLLLAIRQFWGMCVCVFWGPRSRHLIPRSLAYTPPSPPLEGHLRWRMIPLKE